MTAMMTSSCLCGAAKLSFSLGSDQIVAKVNHLFLPRLRRPLPPPHLTLHKPYPKPTNIPPPPQFLCHCTEDRKITGSMFATNLILVLKTPLYANSPPQQAPTLHPFRQTRPPPKSSPLPIPSPVPTTNTPAPSSHATPQPADSAHSVTSHFCPSCGATMDRTSSGFPVMVVIKIGTVDDASLVEGVPRLEVEQFVRTGVGWLGAVQGGEGPRREVRNLFLLKRGF